MRHKKRFNMFTPLWGEYAIIVPIKPGESKKDAERRARIPADFEGLVFYQEVEV